MSYIITSNQITVFGSEGPFTAARNDISSKQWETVTGLLDKQRFDDVIEELSPKKLLERFFVGAHNVELGDNGLYINGKQIDSYPAHKAIEFARAGLPYMPIIHFITQLRSNPSFRAVRDLYSFLEASKMPITPNGNFVAYKKVTRVDGKLVDIYTRKFSNEPGAEIAMPRNEVDEDPERTCSVGLHVCAHQYLPRFGSGPGSAVVAVEVNPADVVAIPIDYNNAKMRVCAYKVLRVLEEWDPADNPDPLSDSLVYDDCEENDEDEDEYAIDGTA